MEEQNFLISLAASDQMRLAFRSHLELMKAVRQDKDDLRNVAQIRARTLTALGLSAAAVGTYLEQGLVHSSKSAEQATEKTSEVVLKAPSIMSRIGRFIGTRSFALGGGLLLGSIGAIGIMQISHQSAPIPVTRTIPQVQSVATPPAAGDHSTIPMGSTSRNTSLKQVNSETIAPRTALDRVSASKTGHGAVNTGSETDRVPTEVSRKTPVVTTTVPGTITASKPKITTPNDSAKAK